MRRFWWSLVVLGFAVACGGRSVRRMGEAEGGIHSGGSAGTDLGFGGSSPTANGGFPAGGTIPVSGTGGTGTSGTGGTIAIGGTSTTTGAQPNGGGPPLDPPGPTRCGGLECSPPLVCCLSNSRCFNPNTESTSCLPPLREPEIEGVPCASNVHCGIGQYCDLRPGTTCQGTGYCQSRTNCPASGYAVCACDGNSYSGEEAACNAGTNVSFLSRSACGQTIDANGGAIQPPRWVTLCNSDAHCGAGERCCHLTSTCYPLSDPGRCQVPPEGTRYPCTADDQCMPEYEYCAGNGCGTPGGCAQRHNDECGDELEPVCGCNGLSYTSAACAQRAGTRVAHHDECGAGGAASE